MTLFDPYPEDPEESRLERNFREFHAAHPEVYDQLRVMALELVIRGWRRLGIGMLWETLRYHTMLGATVPGEDAFRLNNNHRSRYARLLMRNEPLLEGVFETRELQS